MSFNVDNNLHTETHTDRRIAPNVDKLELIKKFWKFILYDNMKAIKYT